MVIPIILGSDKFFDTRLKPRSSGIQICLCLGCNSTRTHRIWFYNFCANFLMLRGLLFTCYGQKIKLPFLVTSLVRTFEYKTGIQANTWKLKVLNPVIWLILPFKYQCLLVFRSPLYLMMPNVIFSVWINYQVMSSVGNLQVQIS